MTNDRCSWPKDTGSPDAAQDAGGKIILLALDKECLSSYIDKITTKQGERTMKLFTKQQLEKLIKNHREQDGTKNFKAEVKLFNPTGIGTWYLSELDPETNTAFGLCCLHEKELGYVSLDELQDFRGEMGLSIERDRWFTPKTLEECEKL